MSSVDSSNIWESFGFISNPFQTNPLSIISDSKLSIENAYISREVKEGDIGVLTFQRFFENPEGGIAIVQGERGIGKTTFVNSFRYEWSEKRKELFTPFGEIQFQKGASPENIISTTIDMMLARIKLEYSEFYETEPLIQEYVKQKEKGIFEQIRYNNLKLYFTQLKNKIIEVLECKGIIVHYDNLDILEKEYLTEILESLRDFLQISNIYFVFVGASNLYDNIIFPLDRVRSIISNKAFDIPVMELDTIKKIISRRYSVCAKEKGNYTVPFEDDLVDMLYGAYEGRIRLILNDMAEIFSSVTNYMGTISTERAIEKIVETQKLELQRLLSPSLYEIYEHALILKEFNATMLKESCGKSRQYLQKPEVQGKFLELNLIVPSKKIKNSQYFRITDKYLVLGKNMQLK